MIIYILLDNFKDSKIENSHDIYFSYKFYSLKHEYAVSISLYNDDIAKLGITLNNFAVI